MSRAAPLPPELGGSFAVQEARRAGVSRSRTRASDLVAPFHGVRIARGDLDHESLCRAYAARMARGHVFSHTTAARLWGLPLPRLDDAALVHVSAPSGSRPPRGRRVAGHRLGVSIRTDVIRGLAVVSAGDAWCQLSARLGLDALVAAGDRLIGWPRPLMAMSEVHAAIDRYGSRPGVVRLRAARALLRPDSASPRETRLRLIVHRAGLPEPECNGAIGLGDGTVTHGDLVFRARGVIEYDGEQHRSDARQFARDVARLNALALAGWTVIRITRAQSARQILALLDRALS